MAIGIGARASNSSLRRTKPKRSFSRLSRREASNYETEPLLEAEGEDGLDLMNVVDKQDVFHLIHIIRKDIRCTIDTHLTWEELTSVDLNFSIVRPLALKYSNYRSLAILYCLLLNRIHFQREASRDLAFQSVNTTRAALCELLSIKLLRTFSSDGLELVTALTASFHPLSGADDQVLSEFDLVGKRLPENQYSSTLELAILSSAKKLISSPLCQRCIDGIWTGRVVLSPIQASHAIVNDSYKKRPLSIYDPAKAPVLNHLRLRVPSIRAKLEFFNFTIILILYVLALGQKGEPHWTTQETLFTIWLLGYVVDEVAQLQEHGISIYMNSLYNLLDFTFCLISLSWLTMRISALRHGVPSRSDTSFDALALGAVLLCPRVASSLVQDNVVLLALKAMLADFAFFTVLASICFSGFLYAFWSLADASRWSLGGILWLMLKVWFGSSYLGFDEAQSFSKTFGPPLMILFAILSNTLLLTVLISLLSNTFQVVASNASEEAMYQHACKTMAGVTTDAIFSYQPPLNLIAVAIVMPLSKVLSPRWLHKINVFLIRLTSFPILLLIRFNELYSFRAGLSLTAERAGSFLSRIPLASKLENWKGKSEMDLISAVFEHIPASFLQGGLNGSWEERAAFKLDSNGGGERHRLDGASGEEDEGRGGGKKAEGEITEESRKSWMSGGDQRSNVTASMTNGSLASTPVEEEPPGGNQGSRASAGGADQDVDFFSSSSPSLPGQAVAASSDKTAGLAEGVASAAERKGANGGGGGGGGGGANERGRVARSYPKNVREERSINRGLGTLTSPLARIFGGVVGNNVNLDGHQAWRAAAEREGGGGGASTPTRVSRNSYHDAINKPLAISRGTFTKRDDDDEEKEEDHRNRHDVDGDGDGKGRAAKHETRFRGGERSSSNHGRHHQADGSSSQDDRALNQRLEKMEERQKRIEALLLKLVEEQNARRELA
ncbi:hypothetical protein IE53DRAFT_90894 [Violaceomyces palustris]|uniref:Uncharacterized protein n=1 Tax=Violaceomyces palustris TaxID=1673888 RepID=A0ACD0P767_9BASI|nr:hypothetical protein IE53DRAFT_90894 [Violaceomyces palustris]